MISHKNKATYIRWQLATRRKILNIKREFKQVMCAKTGQQDFCILITVNNLHKFIRL